MKCALIMGLAASLWMTGGVRAEEPAAESLQLERLRLEAEKARLAAERAAFEAEKAKWEALRGVSPAAATNSPPPPAPTNAPTPPPVPPRVEPLYICVDEAQLYRNRNLAGEMSPLTVVAARPHTTDGWLVLQHKGVSYEAEAADFAREDVITENLGSRVRQLEASLRSKQSDLDGARTRRSTLEERIATLEAQARSTVVVQPVSPSDPGTAPTVYVTDSGIRSFINQLDNELRKLKKDIATRESETGRLSADLTRARQQLDQVEGAFRLYRSARRN